MSWSPSTTTSDPTARISSTTWVGSISVPSTVPGRPTSTVVVGRAGSAPRTVSAGARVPPASATSSDATRWAAAYAAAGSTPRSYRREASDDSLCRRDVRARVMASKWAASMTTSVVASEISVDAPPITPARPIGPESSVISRSSASQLRITSSSVVSFSPAAALRTTIGPVNRAAS